MRVLVTGHRGYIGAVLAPIFQAAGHEVVGLDSDLYRGCTFGDQANLVAIPEIDADLRDVRSRISTASMPSSTSRPSPTTPSATSMPS